MSDSWFRSLTRRLRGAPVDPAEAERQSRVRAYHTAAQQAIAAGTPERLEALLTSLGEFGVTEEEVELEVEMLTGAREAIALRERIAREGLPLLAHQHKALGDDRCHFLASVFLADDDGHRTGRLFLTNRRLFFLATPVLSVPWSRVAAFEDEERDLVIKTVGGSDLLRFRCNSYTDARCGTIVAHTLLRKPAGAAD